MCTSPVPYALGDYGSRIYLPRDIYLERRGQRYTPSRPIYSGELFIVETHPCGGCLHCRIARSRDWAVRAFHEVQVWNYVSSFVTLTYAPEHVPVLIGDQYTLDPNHLRKFISDLKDYMIENLVFSRCASVVGAPVFTHLSCGEYGERFGRPHYHSCLFGVEFTDRVLDFVSPCGENIYRSKLLETLWPYGRCAIGSVTWESAAYVARYITKKITGDAADDHYSVSDGLDWIDDVTGESIGSGSLRRIPEFVDCTRKHAIGKYWFQRYGLTDVAVDDRVIINDRRFPVPRYYDKLLEVSHPDIFARNKQIRRDRLEEDQHNFTLDALNARRTILNQRFNLLERSYEK